MSEGTVCRLTPESLAGAKLHFSSGKVFKIHRFRRYIADINVLEFELEELPSHWMAKFGLEGCSTPGDTRHRYPVTTCGHCSGKGCETCASTGVEIDGGGVPGMSLGDQQAWLAHNFPMKR